MPNHRWARSGIWLLVLIVGCAGVVVLIEESAWARDPARVKYYQIMSSFQGQPETLTGIAHRFLGSAARFDEIFELNVGRVQPDGRTLTDPDFLRPSWLLIQPWDAVGEGIRYGPLPTTALPVPPRPTSPSPSAAPSPTPSPSPSASAQLSCPGLQGPSPGTDAWAQARMAPQLAWSRGRGGGVIVAVIDSGVDASLPQFGGQVANGADIVTGSGDGTTDCLGTGTAMAGLIAAQEGDHGIVGVAPDATILPIKVALDTPTAAVADQATAIDVAVSAGARVIALGSLVDVDAAAVRDAVENAAAHDVVVVVGAPAPARELMPPEVIRVGALARDGRMAQTYAPGSVDVVAPGAEVTSLGAAGRGQVLATGEAYAVALVAGAAALIRGAEPGLTSASVVRRITSTATPMTTGPMPDPATGWGVVDLARAVNATPTHPTVRPDQSGIGKATTFVLTAVLFLILAVVGLRLFQRRRALSADADSGTTLSDEWPVQRRATDDDDVSWAGDEPLPRRTREVQSTPHSQS